jgi:hypothetical protein
VVDEQVPTNVSRPAMTFYSSMIAKLSNDHAMEIGTYAIDKVASRIVSFEEEVSTKIN